MGIKSGRFSLSSLINIISALIVVAPSLLEASMGDTPMTLHRNMTGVTLSIYTHNNITVNNIEKDWSTYSFSDIETMVKLVSTRFSKIGVIGVLPGTGARNKSHEANIRRRHKENVVQAADIINKKMREHTGSAAIELYVGVSIQGKRKQDNLEIQLAKKILQMPNNTVVGLVFDQAHIATNSVIANATAKGIKRLAERASSKKVMLGSRQNCEGLDSKQANDLLELRKTIINQSDFVICQLPAYSSDIGEFEHFLNSTYSNYLRLIKRLNVNIEIMLETDILGTYDNTEELKLLQERWKIVDNWAATNNVTMWINEAFDNRWKNETDAHLGWWMLMDNNKTADVDGYVEKVKLLIYNSSMPQNSSEENAVITVPEPTTSSSSATEPTTPSSSVTEQTTPSSRTTEPTTSSSRTTEPTTSSSRATEPTTLSSRDTEPTRPSPIVTKQTASTIRGSGVEAVKSRVSSTLLIVVSVITILNLH